MEHQPLDVWTLEAHRLMKAKGFWDSYLSAEFRSAFTENILGTKIALMHSELSELLEAIRKDPRANCDKPIPITCEEEEVADIFLRLVDYCGARNINLGRVADAKHQYNKTREHKHGKAF